MPVFIDAIGTMAATGTTLSLQMTPPAGSNAGKGLLAWVTHRGLNSSVSAPAGYGWVASDPAQVTGSHRSRLFWLPNATGAEPTAAWLFTTNVQDLMYGFIVRVDGHDATNFWDSWPIQGTQGGSSTNVTIPGIADGTSQNGALVLQFYSLNNDGVLVTGPSQGTHHGEATTVGSDGALGLVYFNKVTAGIVSDTTLTIDQTLSKNYMVGALRAGGLDITPPGRGSTIAFGAHTFSVGPVDITPAGRASTLAIGTASTLPYLVPLIGTITTPDPGVLPSDCTFVFKLRGPSGSSAVVNQTLAAQYEADPQRSWLLRRNKTTTTPLVWAQTTGTAAAAVSLTAPSNATVGGSPELLALAVRQNNGSSQREIRAWKSLDDGVTWAQGTAAVQSPVMTPMDSNTVMRIGAFNAVAASGDTWDDRIYWMELRTGLDPAAGTVLWRWDADEMPAKISVLLDTLDSDGNGDGIADGWNAYLAVGSAPNLSRSMGAGFQRISGTLATANVEYGIELATRSPVTTGKLYTCRVRAAGVASNDLTVSLFLSWFNSSGVLVSTAAASTLVPTGTPTDFYLALPVVPAGTTTVRTIIRYLGAAGANGDQTGTLDIYEVEIAELAAYTDPRGRVWTPTNPYARVPGISGALSLELAATQPITPAGRASTFAAGDYSLFPGPGPDQNFAVPGRGPSTFAVGIVDLLGGAEPGEEIPTAAEAAATLARTTYRDIRWTADIAGLQFVERLNVPDTAFLANFWTPVGYIFRKCDIHNADGSLWRPNVGIISGSVTVDAAREERRSGDLMLDNIDGDLTIDPEDGLWYDKLIRLWRGIVIEGEAICWRLGTFCIDRMNVGNKTSAISITLRDQTKKMMLSRFAEATAFVAGTDIAVIIRALASNSGINHMVAPLTGQTLDADIFFEADTSRWDAAHQIAEDYSLELFFDANGILILRDFVDPTTAPTYATFAEGDNVIDFDRSTDDSRLFNHIVVIGEGEDETIPNFISEWENNEPTSPTRIDRIGRRTMQHKSAFITSQAQADDLAASLGAVMALESYSVNLNSVVLPYLDVGAAIDFFPADANGSPTRYLMVSLTIPLDLSPMGVVGNRVTIVG